MDKEPITMNKIFIDASYAIALSSVTDRYHHKAVVLSEQIESTVTALTTTRAVILEIGNALARLYVIVLQQLSCWIHLNKIPTLK